MDGNAAVWTAWFASAWPGSSNLRLVRGRLTPSGERGISWAVEDSYSPTIHPTPPSMQNFLKRLGCSLPGRPKAGAARKLLEKDRTSSDVRLQWDAQETLRPGNVLFGGLAPGATSCRFW